MRLKIPLCIISLFCTLFGCSQVQQEKVDFSGFIEHFRTKHYTLDHNNFIVNDTMNERYFQAVTEDYKRRISSNPIYFEIENLVLKNPFGDGYPVSFSVLYEGHLISLFESGSFTCHNIHDLNRNLEMEAQLNVKKFDYHWIFGEDLVALKNKKYFRFAKGVWTNFEPKAELGKRPKLFEDENFMIAMTCRGEWGGNIYFFDKQSGKITFTECTCPNTVTKDEKGYRVLSHLGHGLGTTELKYILNPHQLPEVPTRQYDEEEYKEVEEKMDMNNDVLFDYYGVQMFSNFRYKGSDLYLIFSDRCTYLAEWKNGVFEIVNPLFNKMIYTHDPVTTDYNGTILINLDHYGSGGEREISCILVNENRLIKIDWNEKQHVKKQ